VSDKGQLFFENDDLAELRKIFVRLCNALSIEGPRRAAMREHVANLIIQLACAGERDPACIEQRVNHHLDQLVVLAPGRVFSPEASAQGHASSSG
jgi:hypothetical protein